MFQWLSEKPAKPAVQGDLSRPKTGTLGAGLCQGWSSGNPLFAALKLARRSTASAKCGSLPNRTYI